MAVYLFCVSAGSQLVVHVEQGLPPPHRCLFGMGPFITRYMLGRAARSLRARTEY